ncbi:MAG: AAA family ATPase [Alphaproteobacteria bacterium]|nr:AAA family ATPase [Alphaproteobacteria bacterium]
MMKHPASGTLGHTQFMVFANAASGDAARATSKELGFTHTHMAEGTVDEAVAYLSQHPSPEILLVEIGDAEAAPAQLDALADVVNLHTKVLVTGTVDSIRFYHWLSDLGIDGYLLQPFTATELKHAIAKGSIKKAEALEEKAGEAKKVIAVIGARGGVGTTLMASNLAALFARNHHQPTALVDLDPYFGCAALSLDLEPGRGLRDALEKPDRVDALFLERVMVKPFANLGVLSAEEPLMDVIKAQDNAGEMIFAALREKFSIMVVDLPRQMNPLTRQVLAMADHVIIVAEPQITSLRDTLRLKDYLVDTLKRPVPQVILNRVGLSAANELSAKEFAKNYGHAPVAQFAFLHEVVAQTAQGELLDTLPKLNVLMNPLRALARTLLGTLEEKDAPPPQKATAGALLARLKGGK